MKKVQSMRLGLDRVYAVHWLRYERELEHGGCFVVAGKSAGHANTQVLLFDSGTSCVEQTDALSCGQLVYSVDSCPWFNCHIGGNRSLLAIGAVDTDGGGGSSVKLYMIDECGLAHQTCSKHFIEGAVRSVKWYASGTAGPERSYYLAVAGKSLVDDGYSSDICLYSIEPTGCMSRPVARHTQRNMVLALACVSAETPWLIAGSDYFDDHMPNICVYDLLENERASTVTLLAGRRLKSHITAIDPLIDGLGSYLLVGSEDNDWPNAKTDPLDVARPGGEQLWLYRLIV